MHPPKADARKDLGVHRLRRTRSPHVPRFFAYILYSRAFSQELGAVWTGDVEDESPEKLHCIIDTTPVWKPTVEALKNLKPGGRLVISARRKE